MTARGCVSRSEPLHIPAGYRIPNTTKGGLSDGKDQNDNTARRNGRRRDDQNPLAVDQGYSHHAVHRPEDRILRSRAEKARGDQRSGDDRQRGGDKEIRRRRQVRDDHPERRPRRGIQPFRDVEVAERHDPCGAGRHRVPHADPRQGHHPVYPDMDKADHNRPSRIRRCLQEHRDARQRRQQGRARCHGQRGQRDPSAHPQFQG